jgi:hypothetical protein
MGIKSTFSIDRQTAIAVILNKISNCTNEQLEIMLEAFDESYFRNYHVYNELPDESDESNEYRIIKNVEDF